jgi:nucleoside-diphosphate-sugar epimerase
MMRDLAPRGDRLIELRDSFTHARCLVTGGAGFIGSNLVRRLLDFGARVTVVDNLSTGRRDHLPAHPSLVFVEDDLCRSPDLGRHVAGTDYVFHLAAQVGNIKSIAAPAADAETNVLATVRLLEACRGTSLSRFVYSSSSAIFGEAERLPIDEEHALQPRSFYAVSKLTGERYVRLAADLLSLPTVCLRYFNVYGLPMEANDYTGVISIFLRRLEAGEPLTIYGDGEQLRDFIYVEDVVQANLRAALGGRPGAVYNIGTGAGTTVRELASVLMTLTGRESPIEYAAFRDAEVRRSLADTTLARRELGFAPAFDVRRGLATMLGLDGARAAGGGPPL